MNMNIWHVLVVTLFGNPLSTGELVAVRPIGTTDPEPPSNGAAACGV